MDDRHRRLHRTATPQSGVWTREQALACGFPGTTIDRLAASGQWRRWYGGPVFSAAGTPATWQVRCIAGALRVGGDAVVARRSAARLWGLPGFDRSSAVELLVPREHTPRIPGLTIHRTVLLEPHELVPFGPLVVASVTRTLHDLAQVVDQRTLLLAAAEGYRLGRTDPLRLLVSVHARPRRAGNGRLRWVIERLDDRYRRTRSVAEILGITVLDDLGYRDRYRVNVPLSLTEPRDVEVDVLFGERAVLEILGARYHGDVLRRRADAERRAALEADGYVVAELWASELSDRTRVRTVVEDLLVRAERAEARGPLLTAGNPRTGGS